MKKQGKSFCSECGGILIETSRVVRPTANPLYPITEIKYRCTNIICQAASDKKIADVLKVRQEREEKTRKLKSDFSKTQIPKIS